MHDVASLMMSEALPRMMCAFQAHDERDFVSHDVHDAHIKCKLSKYITVMAGGGIVNC